MTDAAFLREVFPPVSAWGRTYGRVTHSGGAFIVLSADGQNEATGRIGGASERLLSAVKVLM